VASQSVRSAPASGLRVDEGRIYLRPLTEDDVGEIYVAWLNDPLVNRFLETRHRKQDMAAVAEFVRAVNARPGEHLFAICLKESGKHIGNIKVGPVKPNHALADVSLFIGDRDCWGKGYATEAIRAISRHAIRELGIAKLNATAYSLNQGSIRAFLKVGYRHEGTRRKHYMLNGEPADLTELGMCADEFEG
jgi:ribosomal-protein-alanine N-acetyltransferase